MAATRRAQPELHVSLPSTSQPDLPPISALFLIDFDVKAGYTISWKAHRPGIELDGVVEYKSLPSGLHTVSDDLIYFVHDGYAGLSAFVNAPTDDDETRNARMLAVGVLVPLSYGRLGRAWKHAEDLKQLASQLAVNAKETNILQQYWEKHHPADDDNESAQRPKPPQQQSTNESLAVNFQPSPKQIPRGHGRNRSVSDGAALLPPGHKLSPYHPAWSLTRLLDTFGPLIFPIQRAALLRKRILISCHAPVHEICNFVYNISILSNIPLSTTELVSPRSPPHRLRPLFAVGVHDIPFLMAGAKLSTSNPSSSDDPATGWIACTTDSILATKDNLCDMLITMPPAHAANAKERVWPTIEYPRGSDPVKATQRDLRRYRALRAGLVRLQKKKQQQPATPSNPTASTATGKNHNDSTDAEQLLSTELTEDDERRLIDPLSWGALAYSGFMWWASAGEQGRSDEAEEAAHDASLLTDISSFSVTPFTPTMNMSASGSNTNRHSVDLTTSMGSLARAPVSAREDDIVEEEEEARVELAIIAYFHRLTTGILGTLSEALDGGSDDYSDSDSDLGPEPAAPRDGDAGADQEADESEALLRPADDENEDSPEVRRTRGSGNSDRRRPSGRNSIGIPSAAVAAMGLDVWSAADAAFVAEAAERYFARRAHVEGKGVEVCGVRVC